MDFYTDRKFQFLALMGILFAAGLFVYPVYAGLLLIGALIFFGAFSLMWKESHIKLTGIDRPGASRASRTYRSTT